MQNQKSLRFYVYAALAIILLISSWEAEKTDAAVVSPTAGFTAGDRIPEQSIRLRILANSDHVEDQWIKRKVRDAVVESMNEWVQAPKTIEQARTVVTAHLPELERVVADVLGKHGFNYDHYKVELGEVPFPTKIYAGRVYPAGKYEAVRVTLGEGKGQNWWCVLFPPLCFVDVSSGNAVTDKSSAASVAATKSPATASVAMTEGSSAPASVKANASSDGVSHTAADSAGESAKKLEVRFFLLDLLTSIMDFIKGLFS